MRKLKININKVSKKFGDKVVLDKLDLKVFESESLAIIGESGSGKSVLTKCIDGLLSFDTGTISFDKIENIKNLSFLQMNKYMSKFGILFQNAALFDSLTIKENLTFANKNCDLSEILDEVSLPKSILYEFPSNLSIGVQKRIGLARAILQNPEIQIRRPLIQSVRQLLGEHQMRLLERLAFLQAQLPANQPPLRLE